jgi:hypothetical protein
MAAGMMRWHVMRWGMVRRRRRRRTAVAAATNYLDVVGVGRLVGYPRPKAGMVRLIGDYLQIKRKFVI